MVDVEIIDISVNVSFSTSFSSLNETSSCSLLEPVNGTESLSLGRTTGEATTTTGGGRGGGAPGRSNCVPSLGARRWTLSAGPKLGELVTKQRKHNIIWSVFHFCIWLMNRIRKVN